VLAHWKNSQQIDMLPHLDTLSESKSTDRYIVFNRDYGSFDELSMFLNHVGGVMVCMLASSVVDCEFMPVQVKPKTSLDCREQSLLQQCLQVIRLDQNRLIGINQWVRDSCLTKTQQFFLAISWREQANFQLNDDEVHLQTNTTCQVTLLWCFRIWLHCLTW
jgi:hypothetical protein